MITDATGALVDPNTVIAQYFGQNNVIFTPAVTRDSTGKYHYLIDTFQLPPVLSQTCWRRCYAPDGDPGQFAPAVGTFFVTSTGLFLP